MNIGPFFYISKPAGYRIEKYVVPVWFVGTQHGNSEFLELYSWVGAFTVKHPVTLDFFELHNYCKY